MRAKPFVVWAGGKTNLLPQIENYLPKEIREGHITKYVEPFLGGGALFFYIAQKYNIKDFYLSDLNEDLILTYKVVQTSPIPLLELLKDIQKEYKNASPEKFKELYLDIRDKFNSQKKEIDYKKISENWILRASYLLFLNRACFQGIFRVNSKGEFNTSCGNHKKRTNLYSEENILLVSKILQNTEIRHSDYSDCFNTIDEKTFVYFDPPYRPISKTSNFNRYTKEVFKEEEQLQLASFFKKVDKEKGAKIMLSNSDTNDNFFQENFSEYRIFRVTANRSVNPNKKSKISELLIINYSC